MSTLLPALRAGDVDLVVGLLPERRLPAEFDSELLYEEPLVVVVRRGHPLTTVARLDWPMLSGYPMVLPPPSASTRSAIDSFTLEQGVTVPRRHVESISTFTNIGVLQFTDSVGFLARDLARHFAAQGALQVLPLEVPNVTLRIGLVWMVDRRMGMAQRIVRDLLRETAARLPRIAADTPPLPPLKGTVQPRPTGVW
jgi:DNA-binding transcriptional LysR family regulator